MAGRTQTVELERPPVVPDVKLARFLDHIRKHAGCSVREACERAKVSRRDIRWLLDTNPDFASDYRDARGRGDETIRAEIRRRAIDGVDEPVYHQGEIVGHITRYSDRLLGLMAKAQLPEYRETARVELTGPGGGPVEVEDRSASLAEVARILDATGALAELRSRAVAGAVPGAPAALAAPPNR